MHIELTEAEERYAVYVGRRRAQAQTSWEAEKRGGVDRSATSIPTDAKHCIAAGGELAVAKYLNLHWHGTVFTKKDFMEARHLPDVGPFEVRTTTHPRGRLSVRSVDQLARAFVLVIKAGVAHTLLGWNYGHEVAKPEHIEVYYKHPWTDYFGPRGILRPMEELYSTPELTEYRAKWLRTVAIKKV